MINNNFYTYIYLDIRKPGNYFYGDYSFDYEPFYVGKGIGDRLYRHLYGNKYNLHLDRKIKKIKRETGKNPEIIIYDEKLDEQTALDLEKSIIKSIGRADLKLGPLCNLTDGGEGLSGHLFTDEHKKKISEANKDKKFNDETRKKLSDAKKGKKLTDETREKLSKSHIGIKNNICFYNVISPDGEEKIIKCLKDFCDENNWIYSSVRSRISRNKPYKG